MRELKLSLQCKKILTEFISGLSGIYKDDLVSVVLYGSASSGEFVSAYSDLNLLVVLKNTELNNLKRAAGLAGNAKFKTLRPLFFTESYIKNSLDVFPIEFLDIKENYAVLSGADIIRDLNIDIKNLRFQCEHELKAKLISLRQVFVAAHNNSSTLKDILLKSFTSCVHIARNFIRLRGKQPGSLKEDIIRQLSQELSISTDTWKKISALKNKLISANQGEIERLYISFVEDLEKIVSLVDEAKPDA